MTLARLATLSALALVGACDALDQRDADYSGYDDDEPRCRSGLEPATAATFELSQLTIDGADNYPVFDASAVYDREPAACISEDGLHIGVVFELDGEPDGFLELEVPDVGDYYFIEPEGHSTRLSLVSAGDSFSLYNGPDYIDGLYGVQAVGSTFAADGFGSGIKDGHTVGLNFYLSITR